MKFLITSIFLFFMYSSVSMAADCYAINNQNQTIEVAPKALCGGKRPIIFGNKGHPGYDSTYVQCLVQGKAVDSHFCYTASHLNAKAVSSSLGQDGNCYIWANRIFKSGRQGSLALIPGFVMDFEKVDDSNCMVGKNGVQAVWEGGSYWKSRDCQIMKGGKVIEKSASILACGGITKFELRNKK